MSVRTNRWVVAAAIAALILGAILSRMIEPGVRVEKVTLAKDTPALKFIPTGAGPHPVALLAHGNAGSKETLFRYGEAQNRCSWRFEAGRRRCNGYPSSYPIWQFIPMSY